MDTIVKEFLRQLFAFDEQIIDILYNSMTDEHFRKGDYLYQKDRNSECIYLIRKGLVRMYRLNRDHGELNKAFFSENDYVYTCYEEELRPIAQWHKHFVVRSALLF